MTGSYHSLLLFSATLLISVSVLCHGQDVYDVDGKPVSTSTTFDSPKYFIVSTAVLGGGVSSLPKLDDNDCENSVHETTEEGDRKPVTFSSSRFGQLDNVLQVGARYRFAFQAPVVRICNTNWRIGAYQVNDRTSFQPIVAGDYFFSNQQSWFEVRSTDQRGIYKLAACPCEFCRIFCPEVGTYDVNGTTFLGVGGKPFTVKFVKNHPYYETIKVAAAA